MDSDTLVKTLAELDQAAAFNREYYDKAEQFMKLGEETYRKNKRRWRQLIIMAIVVFVGILINSAVALIAYFKWGL
jgi:hypothetical protein